MANKRMFSKQITESDAFLDMPVSSQLLYFHLNMGADDDGFVGNPKKILRMVGCGEDDLKILTAKRFILVFDKGVIVIKHWRWHNVIRKDMYKETQYIEEKKGLEIKENGSYTEIRNESVTKPHHRLDKIRLDKTRIDQIRTDKIKGSSEQSSQVQKIMEIFYKINPTLNWGNKTSRSSAADLIKQFGFDGTVKMAEQIVLAFGKPFAPVATTPYQMKEKLAQFKAYFDGENNKNESRKGIII